jgi:hypothetical protein
MCLAEPGTTGSTAVGKDALAFSSKPNRKTNIDKLVDFSVPNDSAYLENALLHSHPIDRHRRCRHKR